MLDAGRLVFKELTVYKLSQFICFYSKNPPIIKEINQINLKNLLGLNFDGNWNQIENIEALSHASAVNLCVLYLLKN